MSVRLSNALDDREPDRQVGHEVVVHHVDVQPIGAGHRGGLVAELGEVGGQDGRRDQRLRHVRHPTKQGGREHRIGAVPVRPELHRPPAAQVVDRFEQRPGVQCGDVVAAHGVGYQADGLGQVRRAGCVQHHTSRPGQPDRRGQQLTLQLDEAGNVAGLAAPARLWASPQRAEPCARCIDEHAVESRLDTGVAAVDPQHVDGKAAGVLLDEFGAVRGGFDGGDPAITARARQAAPSYRPALSTGPANVRCPARPVRPA